MEKINKSKLDKYTVDNLRGKKEIMPVLTNRNLNIILNKVNELVEAFNEIEFFAMHGGNLKILEQKQYYIECIYFNSYTGLKEKMMAGIYTYKPTNEHVREYIKYCNPDTTKEVIANIKEIILK